MKFTKDNMYSNWKIAGTQALIGIGNNLYFDMFYLLCR